MVRPPIFQKEVDEPLAKGFTGVYPTLSNLIALCTYLLLMSFLSDEYGPLFNEVTMLFSTDINDTFFTYSYC